MESFLRRARWLAARVAFVLAVVAGTAFTGAVLAHPAGAATALDCRTVVAHLVDRPDNGHGTPPVWALDTITRTMTVCHLPALAPAPDATVAVEEWTYNAVLKDTGTFTTQTGAHGSPNDSDALAGGVHGVLSGRANFAKFTAPHDWIAWDASVVDGKTFNGSAPVPTGDWVKQLWKDGFGGSSIESYRWTYQTCVEKITIRGYTEQWVDSSAEGNDDGQSSSAGDITGKACPSRSPSASAQVATSGAAAGVTTSGAASLPVTGSNTPVIAAGGAGLLAAGAVLTVLSMRRRRARVEFTA